MAEIDNIPNEKLAELIVKAVYEPTDGGPGGTEVLGVGTVAIGTPPGGWSCTAVIDGADGRQTLLVTYDGEKYSDIVQGDRSDAEPTPEDLVLGAVRVLYGGFDNWEVKGIRNLQQGVPEGGLTVEVVILNTDTREVLRLEGVWDGEWWRDRILSSDIDGDRADAAKKGKGRAKPNCTKGRPCGGSCIRMKTASGKDTQCRNKPEGAVNEALTRASGGGGGASPGSPQTWQDFVALGQKVFKKELSAIDKANAASQKIGNEIEKLGKEYRALMGKESRTPQENGRIAQIDSRIQALVIKDDGSESLRAFEALRERIIGRGSESLARASAGRVSVPKSLPNANRLDYRDELAKLHQASNNNVDTLRSLTIEGDRAHASRSGTINVGRDATVAAQTATLWHEFGHHLEFSSPQVGVAAQGFIRERATGTPQPLSNLVNDGSRYRADEIAYPGRFLNPYVGKVYNNDPGSTEVISVGLERFSSARLMEDFYRLDREHMMLVLGVLGRNRGRG